MVVAAVNRLDGRQYAVKKIPLDTGSPAAHSRIMREVATLSRLQHPHVVRYFQAWCEVAYGASAMEVGGEEDSEYDDWLGSNSSGQPSRPLNSATPSVSFGGRLSRLLTSLQPVAEFSGVLELSDKVSSAWVQN